ncbi:MAG: type II secretion system protein [Alphaproteobacteria bacterium]|nr:type II secretion system protein [Alphaproteobacteria bacterium]
MHTNQEGRSMIEMLGVLGIIGVLSVGGLMIVGKARRQQEITQDVSEVSQLIDSAKKMSCQYDTEYGNYANFLYRSEAYPSGIEYGNGKFTLSSDLDVEMPYVAAGSGTDESMHPHFVVKISNMSDDTCVNLASSNWGATNGNGFIGATFTNVSDFSVMLANYPRMDPGTAATGCVDNATLYLGFRACK